MAAELGVDRVFGRGTTPGEVASLPRPPARHQTKACLHGRRGRHCGSCTAATCPTRHAHYAGNLVDGAYSLGLFGDVATEMCIRTDGDEGLFASYSDVQFRAPVRAGDVLEVSCELVRVGTRSRVMDFAVHVVARGAATDERPGAAEVLAEPLLATTATGTVVVP